MSGICPGSWQMNAITVKVDSAGRLVIPKEMRKELGISEGGELRGSTRLAAFAVSNASLRRSRRPAASHRSWMS